MPKEAFTPLFANLQPFAWQYQQELPPGGGGAGLPYASGHDKG